MQDQNHEMKKFYHWEEWKEAHLLQIVRVLKRNTGTCKHVALTVAR
jgi:hypothetical protein